MNMYSNLKDLIELIFNFNTDNIVPKKIVFLLKMLSVCIVCLTFYVIYSPYSFDFTPINCLFFFVFYENFEIYTFTVLILITVVRGFLYILRMLIFSRYIDFNFDFFPLFQTLEDIAEISQFLVLIIKLIESLLFFANSRNPLRYIDKFVYFFYLIALLTSIFKYLYIKNQNNYLKITKKYTPYFDCDGNRIAENDVIIYNNKLYSLKLLQIHQNSDFINNNPPFIKLNWCLIDSDDNTILLEDAANDVDGKLKIYKISF